MCKFNSPQSTPGPNMSFFQALDKLKRLKPVEPSLGVLGFFILTLICFISCFFYLDYRLVLRFGGQTAWPNVSEDRKMGVFGGEGSEGCDLFTGSWVWDDNYPIYQSADCPFLDLGFRCSENGRPDTFYTKWRWQPKHCNLPRGCYFQEGREVKINMSIENAYRRSFDTVFKWIQKEVNKNKTQVFFRTYAPVHFRGGDWKTGGNCHMETLPELGSPMLPRKTWAQFSIVNEMLLDHSNKSQVMGIDVLNVTQLTSWRKDGHSSVYYLSPKPAPLHKQDCSHWCLPGVPDVWNELLYALFLRREVVRNRNSTADIKAQS